MTRSCVLVCCLVALLLNLVSGSVAIQAAKTKSAIRHESGFVFPKVIDQFRLVAVRKFDPAGHDTSYGYNHVSLPVIVTIYVYPKSETAPRSSLAGHFADLVDDLEKNHQGAKIKKSERILVQLKGSKQRGMRTTFTVKERFAGRTQNVISELDLFSMGDYFVKFRITYAKSEAAKCEKAVSKLIGSLSWPK